MDKVKYSKFCIVVAVIILIFLFYTNPVEYIDQVSVEEETTPYKNDAYLVYSSKCRIPKVDPWDKEIQHLYRKYAYAPCSIYKPLTYVVNNRGNSGVLHINREIEPQYSKNGVRCCFSYIFRIKREEKRPDDSISVSNCTWFDDNAPLFYNTVLVKCFNKRTLREVYKNTHAFALLTPELKMKTQNTMKSRNGPSVLLVGIDSISRMNMRRSLPRTYDFLKTNRWIDYKGYNKIADNTFPNVGALLTGRNSSDLWKTCQPWKLGALDKCNFLWHDYADLGYVTAYAEDEIQFNIFSYMAAGFNDPPTDIYYKPYVLASEDLGRTTLDHMTYCSGQENSCERILNAAKDFAVSLKEYPTFGLFWMSSCTHNNLNAASRIDDKVREFLEEITAAGVLENSIVVFLSDHGLRFGNIRLTHIGWLEERLPFLYLSIPETFQNKFPNEYKNVVTNAERLETPYDLHMTLKHILVLSGHDYEPQQSNACSKCGSFFNETESERSCEDASIEMHWCTCTGYKLLDPSSELGELGAQYTLAQLNKNIAERAETARNCVPLKFYRVISTRISSNEDGWYKNDTYVLVVFATLPETILEVTLKLSFEDMKPSFEIEGFISRLDYYKFNSECVESKIYCYCTSSLLFNMRYSHFLFEV